MKIFVPRKLHKDKNILLDLFKYQYNHNDDGDGLLLIKKKIN